MDKTTKIVLISLAAALLLGGTGYFLYRYLNKGKGEEDKPANAVSSTVYKDSDFPVGTYDRKQGQSYKPDELDESTDRVLSARAQKKKEALKKFLAEEYQKTGQVFLFASKFYTDDTAETFGPVIFIPDLKERGCTSPLLLDADWYVDDYVYDRYYMKCGMNESVNGWFMRNMAKPLYAGIVDSAAYDSALSGTDKFVTPDGKPYQADALPTADCLFMNVWSGNLQMSGNPPYWRYPFTSSKQGSFPNTGCIEFQDAKGNRKVSVGVMFSKPPKRLSTYNPSK